MAGFTVAAVAAGFTVAGVVEPIMRTPEHALTAAIVAEPIVGADTAAVIAAAHTMVRVAAITVGVADIGAILVTGTEGGGDSVLALAGGDIGPDTGIRTVGGAPPTTITLTMFLTAIHTPITGTVTLPQLIPDLNLPTAPRRNLRERRCREVTLTQTP